MVPSAYAVGNAPAGLIVRKDNHVCRVPVYDNVISPCVLSR